MAKIRVKNRHDKMASDGKMAVKTSAHKKGHLEIKHHNKRSQGRKRGSKKTIL